MGPAVITVGVAIVSLLVFVATRRLAASQRSRQPMSGRRAIGLFALGAALIALGVLLVSCASWFLVPQCCHP